MSRISIRLIQKQKKIKKIVCLTASSVSVAKIIDKYVDIILIGDSLGMVIYGMKNTQSVTLDMMKVHGKAVVMASKKALTIIDMPFGTYKSKKQSLSKAKELLNYTKCQAVKVEADENTIEIIKYLSDNKIKVVSHIGVTPQKYKNFNKIHSVGKSNKDKIRMLDLSKKLEKAGSCMIVLECMQESLAKTITDNLSIPTIGIGASLDCDGQILVVNDILNTDNSIEKPKFVKSYINLNQSIEKAVRAYRDDVLSKKFPTIKNIYK